MMPHIKGVDLHPKNNFYEPFQTEILSINSEIAQFIPLHPAEAVIIGWFRRAIDVTVQNKLIAFVLPELLNGPFHVVVNDLPPQSIQRTVHIQRLGNRIDLGDWSFLYTPHTKHWESMPQWEDIVLEPAQIDLLQQSINNVYKSRPNCNEQISENIVVILGQSRINDFWHALRLGNITGAANAVQAIIGRGPGLTPAGDDFLAGIMISFWLLHYPETETICRLIAESSRQRTTEISYAYFSSIAAGRVDERWHRLLAALNTGNQQLLEKTIRHILIFGASSGSDILRGLTAGIAYQTSTINSP